MPKRKNMIANNIVVFPQEDEAIEPSEGRNMIVMPVDDEAIAKLPKVTREGVL